MEITEEQYRQIEHCLPKQRGNVSHTNLRVINAILYVAEHGCKWRGLPKRFGNWHTVYTRMNRWSKNGVLDRVFGELQHAQIVRIKIEAVGLDSSIVKVHPDGTGALKKMAFNLSASRTEDGAPRNSYGCRGCSNGHNLRSVPGGGARCSAGAQAAAPVGPSAVANPSAHGSCVRGRGNPATGAAPELHSRGSAQEQSSQCLGIRSRDVQATQRDRTTVPATEGIPAHFFAFCKTQGGIGR